MAIVPHSARPLRLGVLAVGLGVALAFSCKTFDLPTESCDPSGLDAQRLHGEEAEGVCSRCLEDKCCDKVGVCSNKDGCSDLVRNVHDCVIKAGINAAADERGCAANLASIPEADSTYRCMRDSCGNECGLPVCAVTPAATLFRNPACDGCLASSCCPQLNECYGSRACQLSLECISRECGPELGQALVDIHDAGGVMAILDPDGGAAFCAEGGANPFIGPACVRNCLCTYQLEDQGLPPVDPSKQSLLLARAVYQCAGAADCGDRCRTRVDGGAP